MATFLAGTFDANIYTAATSNGSVAYTDVGRLVANLYLTLVIVSGIAAFIFLAMGGFQYITSGGDKVAVEQARGKITYSLMGLAIVVGLYAFSYIMQFVFGVSIIGGVKWPGP